MNRAKGFSLVELMISLVLGMLVVGMAVAAYLSGTTTQRSLTQTSMMTENGRFSLQRLSDEIQMAGFYGNHDYVERSVTALPDICTLTAAQLEYGLRVAVQGYNDVDTATLTSLNACVAYITGTVNPVVLGSDILVIRRTNSNIADITALDATTFYLQTTPSDFVLDTGSNSVNFDLEDKDGNPAQVRELEQNIFFLSQTTDDLRQLKQLTLDGNTYSQSVIADNIQSFQVEYGIDTTGNGAAETYVEAPTLDQLTDITSVRINLLVRSESQDISTTDSKIYNLGLAGNVGPFNDQFRRRVFQITSRVNNISMRRER